jgi:hypothetical protein
MVTRWPFRKAGNKVRRTDVVQQLSAASVPGPTAPFYEAALQPRNTPGTLCGVQVVEYAKFGLNGPLSDDQIQEIIRTVTGLDVNAIAKDSLKPEYGSLVNGARIVSSHWDAAKRRFTYAVEMNVNGVGNVRVSAAVYFGRNAMVQLAFSTTAEQWNNNWPVCGQIFESFRFEEPRGIGSNGPVAFTSPYSSLFNK